MGEPIPLPRVLCDQLDGVEQRHTYAAMNEVFAAIERAGLVLVPKCSVCPVWTEGDDCGGCYIDLSVHYATLGGRRHLTECMAVGHPEMGYPRDCPPLPGSQEAES